MKNFFKVLLPCMILLHSISVKATHNRSGEIVYKRIAPFTKVSGTTTVQVYTYSITVIKYTDDDGGGNPPIADRCVDTVRFGDGTLGVAPRINGGTTCSCGSTITCGEIIINIPGYRVKKNIYSIVHTYGAPGAYLIRSIDPNRNSNIVNIASSVNQPFYIESLMHITATLGENSSPVFTKDPIKRGVVGACFIENYCAIDIDGDSLSYELSTNRGENGQTLTGYSLPITGSNGSLAVHATSGTLTWCKPQAQGEYALAMLIKEWRRPSCGGAYQIIGYILKDIQVIVETSPTIFSFSTTGPVDTCVIAGSIITKNFSAVTSPTAVITTSLFGAPAYPAFTPTGGISTVINSATSTTTFTWQTTCNLIQHQPHNVHIFFRNNTSQEQSEFRQFNVKVVPPSPIIHKLTKDTGEVTLYWKYTNLCSSQLQGYNIYRKTGVNNWSHGPCETGVPSSSGFTKIGSATASDTMFTDSNIYPILNGTTGHYAVTAITKNCVESFAEGIQTTVLLVGLSEKMLPHQSVQVFPNPSHNDFQINFSGSPLQYAELDCFSIDGKLISSKKINVTSENIVTIGAELAPGTYLLKIKSEEGTSCHRLIKL